MILSTSGIAGGLTLTPSKGGLKPLFQNPKTQYSTILSHRGVGPYGPEANIPLFSRLGGTGSQAKFKNLMNLSRQWRDRNSDISN
jgi:hypothetical protein